MPQRGRELFELKYGIVAKSELQKGLAQNDLAIIRNVSRKFFHTEAGYVATLVLGRRALSDGDPENAGRYFRRLRESEITKSRLDPEISIFHAVSMYLSGSPAKAADVIDDLKPNFPTIHFHLAEHIWCLFSIFVVCTAFANSCFWIFRPASSCTPARTPKTRKCI